VFKLKGADRKHKQDRERLNKRPESEKEKFSPQYDCTMLTDLSVDSIYIPSGRGVSPSQVGYLLSQSNQICWINQIGFVQ
jgi:transcription factor CP2-like protein